MQYFIGTLLGSSDNAWVALEEWPACGLGKEGKGQCSSLVLRWRNGR